MHMVTAFVLLKDTTWFLNHHVNILSSQGVEHSNCHGPTVFSNWALPMGTCIGVPDCRDTTDFQGIPLKLSYNGI